MCSSDLVLTDPFPNPDTNLVAMDPDPSSQVLMLSTKKPSQGILVLTRNKDYGSPSTNQPTTSTTNPYNELVPPTVIHELRIKPPKGVIHKSIYNPPARAAKNFNIVEDLAQ